MINPVRSELLLLVQASIGWAVLAVRAAGTQGKKRSDPADIQKADAPIRLRATITIDIDAADPSEVERESAAIQQQFQSLKHRFPNASLNLRRRKPRAARRPAAPKIIVTPYADD